MVTTMNIPWPATTSLQVDEEMQLQLEQELADWGAPATRDGKGAVGV